MTEFYFYKIRNVKTGLYYSKYNLEGKLKGNAKGITYSRTPNFQNMIIDEADWEIVRYKAVEDCVIN